MAERARHPRADLVEALHGKAFNLLQWIAGNLGGELGPVGNKEVYKDSDFIFMIVKGPNARNDYHVDPYDEIFYQLQGTIHVGLVDEAGTPHEVAVREGEVLLVKAMAPHSPRRPAGTLGLVVERPRVAGENDGILWFCPQCHAKLHEITLRCEDIETTLRAALDAFNDDEALRTCKKCGAVLPDPRPAP